MIESSEIHHGRIQLIVVLWAAVAAPAIFSVSGCAHAAAEPSFEVATIEPGNPYVPGMGIIIQEHRFSTHNTTLNFLIKFAYGLNARRIVGGQPGWTWTNTILSRSRRKKLP
jgi:hypothetical protein